MKHLRKPKPLSAYLSETTDLGGIESIVAKSTAADKRDRYPSLAEFLHDLKLVQQKPATAPLGSEPTHAISEAASNTVFRSVSRHFLLRRKVIFPVLVSLLAAIAGISAFSFYHHPAAPTKKLNAPTDASKPFSYWPPHKTKPEYTGNTISVDFQNAELADAFHEIANQAGFNVVVDPEVRGKANLKLTKVPWDQVIEILCKDNHLDYRKEGNILYIDVIVYDLPEGLGLGKAKQDHRGLQKCGNAADSKRFEQTYRLQHRCRP